MEWECKICKELTEYFLKHYPDRRGSAMCEKCIENAGVIPMDFSYYNEYIKREKD